MNLEKLGGETTIRDGLPTFAAEQHIGRSRQRTALEDRVRVEQITTAGGLSLIVAMVADGIGGGNYGERAAQLALDDTFETLIEATTALPEQIPQMLQNALSKANDSVYQEARHTKQVHGMGSTATLAVIHAQRLYLANVGDSRAYLIRDGEVWQLTQDHTWAREMVQKGRLTADKATVHPKAEELMRSIGYEPAVTVDLGVYVRGDEVEAEAAQNQGLFLRAGDRVVVCSDGLIKTRHDAPGNYVEKDEIRQIVTRYVPDKAARALVQQALDRDVDDNVSAIVLEMPGSKRSFYIPRLVWYGLGAVLVALLLGFTIFGFLSSEKEPDETAVVSPSASLIASSTPTSSAPTPEPGQVAILAAGSGATATGQDVAQSLQAGDRVPAVQDLVIQAGPDVLELLLSDGTQLFLGPETIIELNQVAGFQENTETSLQIRQGHLVVQATGPVVVTSRLGARAMLAAGESLMGVSYGTDGIVFQVDCLKGTCRLAGDRDISGVPLVAGGQGQVDVNGEAAVSGEAQYELYTDLTGLVPTPTPTPTHTSTPTATATPSATYTPIPPTATYTPIPPTATSVPPTATSKPPTATPEPPSTPPPKATLKPTVPPPDD